LEDVHGLEDAISAQKDEIVAAHLDVETYQIGNAGEVGLQLAFHLVLVVLNVLHANLTT